MCKTKLLGNEVSSHQSLKLGVLYRAYHCRVLAEIKFHTKFSVQVERMFYNNLVWSLFEQFVTLVYLPMQWSSADGMFCLCLRWYVPSWTPLQLTNLRHECCL